MGPGRAVRILAITGGHRVDMDAFTGMLGDICAERGWVFAHAAQRAAQEWLAPEHRGVFDAVLCHDLPGLDLRRGHPPQPIPPAPEVARTAARADDPSLSIDALRAMLASPKRLREVALLGELLQPPVSLRASRRPR